MADEVVERERDQNSQIDTIQTDSTAAVAPPKEGGWRYNSMHETDGIRLALPVPRCSVLLHGLGLSQ